VTYLFTATSVTENKTQIVQKIVQNVERHGDCVAFFDPFQPHTSSREFPLYESVSLRIEKISVARKSIVKVQGSRKLFVPRKVNGISRLS